MIVYSKQSQINKHDNESRHTIEQDNLSIIVDQRSLWLRGVNMTKNFWGLTARHTQTHKQQKQIKAGKQVAFTLAEVQVLFVTYWAYLYAQLAVAYFALSLRRCLDNKLWIINNNSKDKDKPVSKKTSLYKIK